MSIPEAIKDVRDTRTPQGVEAVIVAITDDSVNQKRDQGKEGLKRSGSG